MPGDHPCPTCGAPLVLDGEGLRFLCSRAGEGCFEELPANGTGPMDLAPGDGPESVHRILLAKERLHELALLARELGILPATDHQGGFYALVASISLSESYLHLGRLRAWLDERLAARGEAPPGLGSGPDG